MSALTTVTRTQGNNRALKDGMVRPKHADLRFEEVPVLVQAFRRMVRGLEFDVCEMAASTYLCAKAFGVRFTAIPVFLVRGFHHGAIVVDRDSTLAPKDLEGTAVGVNRGYTVTTGVWARSVLSQEYGVDLSRVTWMPSGSWTISSGFLVSGGTRIATAATICPLSRWLTLLTVWQSSALPSLAHSTRQPVPPSLGMGEVVFCAGAGAAGVCAAAGAAAANAAQRNCKTRMALIR